MQKQKQMTVLRQTNILRLTLDATPIFFSCIVQKWIDILRQTLSLWFETEWKVLLKQRQTIGLRQTEKSCLTLHAEPIAWLKVHENEYLRIEH